MNLTSVPTLAQNICHKQKEYFNSGATRSLEFRLKQLKLLKESIKKYEKDLLEALYKDLRKSKFEAFTSEIGFIYHEIDYALKNVETWMESQSVGTPIVIQPAMSRIYYEPKGVILILGPFNYPFMLLFSPLVSAIAAGNTAILKPSENTPFTEIVISKIIENTFEEKYICVVAGQGELVVPELINNFEFDHIFFTGSQRVGKEIMRMAAHHLTPVTLELGGKSPAIVHTSANLSQAAKKIIWGKAYNAGQTCVSPDYAIVHELVFDKFIEHLKKQIKKLYGDDPQKSKDYGRIVNTKRFDALTTFFDEGKIVSGGRSDRADLYIEPTIMVDINMEGKIMSEEIFGPILPVLTYQSEEDLLRILRKNPNPLACYVFTSEVKFEDYVIENFTFGGGAVNNTLAHLGNPELPFGGRGKSGLGACHGKFGFDIFSHSKSILKSPSTLDPSILYPPYNELKMKIARWFLK